MVESAKIETTEAEPNAGAKAISRLAHFPVAFFAAVMGSAGFAIATQRAEQTFGAGNVASTAISVFAGGLFLVLAAVYLAKALRHPAAVLAEWRHPVRLSFFATVSIGVLLLSVTALPHARLAAESLWLVGTTLQLFVSLSILSAWIGDRKFETPHLNPAWFIPAVGNIVVPLAGVPLGHVETSWFFFAVGVLFWVVLLTLVFNRLIFHHPLPERLVPTLMILVAPPAVAFLAYMRLTGGALDPFARILFYAALSLFLLVACQIRRLVRLRFALSWWAYSFPLAALTTATAVYGEAIGSALLKAVFVALYALLAAVMTLLAFLTIRALARGEIMQPET
jgi:tellurite resistance protein